MNGLEQRPTIATPSAQLCYRLDLEIRDRNWLAATILLISKYDAVDIDVLRRKTIVYFEMSKLLNNDAQKLQTSLECANTILNQVDDPQVLLNRIVIYKIMNATERVLEDQTRFNKFAPQLSGSTETNLPAPVLRYLLSQHKKKSEWDKIIDLCLKNQEVVFKNPEIGNKYAKAHAKKKDFVAALKIYEKILSSNADPEAQQGQIECLIELQQFKEAEQENLLLAQMVPNNCMSDYFKFLILSKTSIEGALDEIFSYKQKKTSFKLIDDLEQKLKETLATFLSSVIEIPVTDGPA